MARKRRVDAAPSDAEYPLNLIRHRREHRSAFEAVFINFSNNLSILCVVVCVRATGSLPRYVLICNIYKKIVKLFVALRNSTCFPDRHRLKIT